MPQDTSDLNDLRRQIDEIDASLHDAIVQRIALIDRIAAAKGQTGGDTTAMRPNREAEVVRGLASRHHGPLQTAALVRVWRELINAATAMQGPLTVAVCAPERSVGYWDLARNHFGSGVPMTLHTSPSDVLRTIDEAPGAIGLLPMPQEGEAAPWWPALASQPAGTAGAKVVWRLPFFASPTGRFENLEALAVAKLAPEASGQDRSLLVVETDLDVSRARVVQVLGERGLTARPLATHEADGERRAQLLEVDGLIDIDGPAVAGFAEAMGEALLRVSFLGAYPVALADERAEPS
ncbi:MAG: chorismate mutase [Alphaproteobacteria bacterium]|jgi:chorismate mutase|nr:chorismate mutase [Alphaproteobacteria bacterium]MDP6566244.1 chorismate mutase [Alphaproteobacteria bacterium]MDP6815189.1 chorismate mutase [Alphaproteobacteria bacterium]